MKTQGKACVAALTLLSIGLSLPLIVRRSAPVGTPSAAAASAAGLPRIVLWAWERPEDLRFLDPRKVGVAFLARTVFLSGDAVFVKPRLQPLAIAPGTHLVAVVRIEINRTSQPTLSDSQRAQAVDAIADAAQSQGISSLQVDFDARGSERAFYRALLTGLRARLPAPLPVSITALASWCIGDDWLGGLPIDDAIPMLFRMGPDRSNVLFYLSGGRDFQSTACRQSVGVSTDEPLPPILPGRRIFIFHPRAWSPAAVQRILKEINQ